MSFTYSNAQFAKYNMVKQSPERYQGNITSSSTEIIKERFIQRENFLIKKLKTLAPYGLKQKLSQIHNVQFLYSLRFALSAQGTITYDVLNLSRARYQATSYVNHKCNTSLEKAHGRK